MRPFLKNNQRLKISMLFFSCLVVLILNLQTQTTLISHNTLFSKDYSLIEIHLETTDKLTIYDFSHYNQPIYPNYTKINAIVKLESQDVNLADIYIHYTHDFENWNSVKCQRIYDISDNISLFQGEFGPFTSSGEYFVKINATKGSLELATVKNRFTVETIQGLIFVNFEYLLITQTDKKQYVKTNITILGNDLRNDSVSVITDQAVANNTYQKMTVIPDLMNTYNITLGPIDQWATYVHLRFNATTLFNITYSNADFFFKKSPPKVIENFLRSKLPAIIVSVIATGAMVTIFVMHKKRPPANYE